MHQTTDTDWRQVLDRVWSRWAPPGEPPLPPWQRRDETEEFAALCRSRLEHVVDVAEPLVLISQVQRSGGTLLSQLFDGHPECHAHPGELSIGKPKKWDWPHLDLSRPDDWFEMLFEPPTDLYLRKGYLKEKPLRDQLEPDVFPFVFSPRLQRSIFDRCAAQRRPARERDVLDCYFTSYFNAWLDNHNLYPGPKRVVTAFAPRLAIEPERVEQYFAAYPDGLLVSIVRDPGGWYSSASMHRDQYADIESAVGLWRRSVESALDAHERYPGRVLLLTFEQLVLETEPTVRRIADRIGITMSPVLLEPTFNGRPIRANSTGRVDRTGIVRERTDAYREVLDRATLSKVEAAAGDLYRRAAAVAAA
ncbi:MAG TPA: sulfotransferase [Gaiellaceae bacterium]